MRLVDTLLRGGHLSERALVDAVMTGERPAHLEHCDICAERAVDLGRWLDQMRGLAIDAADAAFPAERLAAQQQQIMRRLEQLDQPARVIAFPNQFRLGREMGGRRVSVGWVAVAAAAGIFMGVLSTQAAERIARRGSIQPVATQAAAAQAVSAADVTTDAPAVTPAAIAENPAIVDETESSLPTSMLAWATPRTVNVNLLTLKPTQGGK